MTSLAALEPHASTNVQRMQMARFTMASGKTVKKTDSENNIGKTAPTTKAAGKTVRSVARESWYMPTEMSTRVNGQTIKLTVKEFTNISMAQGTSASGRTTNSMAVGSRHGLMAPFMKVNTRKVLGTERAS